ncbi:MAG TPA: hypothetical protein GX400_12995 [Chloroflexi bacterium]|nr:hypothetical protein [Chloroflexota bacterium]
MTSRLIAHSSLSAPEVGGRAPMASAPMVYNDDGSVAWERMWTTFCELASVGGPPHRGELLQAPTGANANSSAYRQVVHEIIRGIQLVSGLHAAPATPGWIAIECLSSAQARWLSEQINQENVECHWCGKEIFVPAAANFTLKGEIKNVITAVAKTTHYWDAHVSKEVKQTLAFEAALQKAIDWLRHCLHAQSKEKQSEGELTRKSA